MLKEEAQLEILKRIYKELEDEHSFIAEHAYLYTDERYHYEAHQEVYRALGNQVFMMMRIKKEIVTLERNLSLSNKQE